MSVPGLLLPAAAAALFFANVQLNFRLAGGGAAGGSGSGAALPRALGHYKLALEWLTLPALYAGLTLPHAVCLYWLPNNAITLAQTALLRSPAGLRALAPGPRPAAEVPPAAAAVAAPPLAGEEIQAWLRGVDKLSVDALVLRVRAGAAHSAAD